jgi:hypothetical protein
MPKGQDCLLQVVLPLLVSMPPVYALKTHKIREAIATSSIQFEKVEPIQFNVEIVFQVMRKSTMPEIKTLVSRTIFTFSLVLGLSHL